MGTRAGLDGCGKSAPTGIRSPDRPTSNESLYRPRLIKKRKFNSSDVAKPSNNEKYCMERVTT